MERLNSIGRSNIPNIGAGILTSISKFNVNFNNDAQMSSSGTNLVGYGHTEESKMINKPSNGMLSGLPSKKTL